MKPILSIVFVGLWGGMPSLVFADAAPAPAQAEIVWPTTRWEISTPEEQGMSSAALSRLIDFGESVNLDSMLVVRHGKIVTEAYYGPYKRGVKHTLYSATKAVIGTLIGIEVQRGLLAGPNEPVLDFFPERTIANVNQQKKEMTIQSLLDMTSGIDWSELLMGVPISVGQMTRRQDWIQFILDRPMAGDPGAAFNYDSGNPHLLSAIITKTTGRSALDFAKEQLFQPLGISDVRWNSDPKGISIGGFGLYLTPRDMAKIGYLYLKNGRWEGRQLLPQAWIDRVKHASVIMNVGGGNFHYANLFWTLPARNAFWADGKYSQIILVLPDSDMVAVFTGRGFADLRKLINHVSEAVKSDEPLPSDPVALAGLGQRIGEAALEKPSAIGRPSPMAAVISGRTIRFPKSAQGLVSTYVLNLTSDHPSVERVGKTGMPGGPDIHFRGPIGLDGYFRFGKLSTGQIIGIKGAWSDDNTFSMTTRILEDGTTITSIFQFIGNSVDVETTGGGFGTTLEEHGKLSR